MGFLRSSKVSLPVSLRLEHIVEAHFFFFGKVPLAVVLRLDLFSRAPKNCRIPYISTKIGIGILRRPNLGKKKARNRAVVGVLRVVAGALVYELRAQ